ncbi:MAG TPA: hypothetical protein VF614_01770 [Chthoniobacteraceae bacterium]
MNSSFPNWIRGLPPAAMETLFSVLSSSFTSLSYRIFILILLEERMAALTI